MPLIAKGDEFLRLMQIGTNLTKIKKKNYSRIYHLDNDLFGVTWHSRFKSSTKARSECFPPLVYKGGGRGGWVLVYDLIREEGRDGGREGGKEGGVV